MLIKHIKRERVEFDVGEWNDEIKAYVKPLNSLEALVFNDYARDFFDKSLSVDERFLAAFSAAKMTLVDGDGAPLLTDDDFDAIKYASFTPLFRVFNVVLNETTKGDSVESAKKN